jgi:hypothetical protein
METIVIGKRATEMLLHCETEGERKLVQIAGTITYSTVNER